MAHQDGAVDVIEGDLVGEGHVEDGEETDKARVDLVASPAGLAHGSHPADVLHGLPVEVFAAVVAATPLYEQLEQSNRLLGAVDVHLGRYTRINSSNCITSIAYILENV